MRGRYKEERGQRRGKGRRREGKGEECLPSVMRWARASAEKPPNTTECTAPIRAQASMAIGSSHTSGMYIATASPLTTPFFFSQFAWPPASCVSMPSAKKSSLR